jgi:hypothetical protein
MDVNATKEMIKRLPVQERKEVNSIASRFNVSYSSVNCNACDHYYLDYK